VTTKLQPPISRAYHTAVQARPQLEDSGKRLASAGLIRSPGSNPERLDLNAMDASHSTCV